jgi:sulfate transport system ATP-binding protein
MSFVGPVNRLGNSFVRPHDVELLSWPDASGTEAMVERIVHLGFEVRVELLLPSGERIWSQATRDRVAELELRVGDVVHVRIAPPRMFA